MTPSPAIASLTPDPRLNPIAGDLYVDWDTYHQTIEALARQIEQSAWPFEAIVCLARGGLRPGDILSRWFNRPLAVMAAASYGGETGRDRDPVRLAAHVASLVNPFSGRILLVDDLADSGATLQAARAWLMAQAGSPTDQQAEPQVEAKAAPHVPLEIRTAVLWWKGQSSLKPDYWALYLPQNPWIHQPFEVYDRLGQGKLLNKKL